MFALYRRFVADRSGATSIEYVFIASLISIVAIVAMGDIGSKTLAYTSSILTGFR